MNDYADQWPQIEHISYMIAQDPEAVNVVGNYLLHQMGAEFLNNVDAVQVPPKVYFEAICAGAAYKLGYAPF